MAAPPIPTIPDRMQKASLGYTLSELKSCGDRKTADDAREKFVSFMIGKTPEEIWQSWYPDIPITEEGRAHLTAKIAQLKENPKAQVIIKKLGASANAQS